MTQTHLEFFQPKIKIGSSHGSPDSKPDGGRHNDGQRSRPIQEDIDTLEQARKTSMRSMSTLNQAGNQSNKSKFSLNQNSFKDVFKGHQLPVEHKDYSGIGAENPYLLSAIKGDRHI
jgi:hypothetical protein